MVLLVIGHNLIKHELTTCICTLLHPELSFLRISILLNESLVLKCIQTMHYQVCGN